MKILFSELYDAIISQIFFKARLHFSIFAILERLNSFPANQGSDCKKKISSMTEEKMLEGRSDSMKFAPNASLFWLGFYPVLQASFGTSRMTYAKIPAE